MGRHLAVIALLLYPALGAAQTYDPDTEAARRHFALGSQRYEQGDYPGALVEFEAARKLKPLAELDYNVARCHDRLEHYPQALAEYKKYLKQKPDAEVQERVKLLEERVAVARPVVVEQQPVEKPRPQPIYKKWWLWTTVGLVVAAGVGVGLGVGLTQSAGPEPSTDLGTFEFGLR
jgi:tetratricopeptide (TPR) repeat protein